MFAFLPGGEFTEAGPRPRSGSGTQNAVDAASSGNDESDAFRVMVERDDSSDAAGPSRQDKDQAGVAISDDPAVMPAAAPISAPLAPAGASGVPSGFGTVTGVAAVTATTADGPGPARSRSTNVVADAGSEASLVDADQVKGDQTRGQATATSPLSRTRPATATEVAAISSLLSQRPNLPGGASGPAAVSPLASDAPPAAEATHPAGQTATRAVTPGMLQSLTAAGHPGGVPGESPPLAANGKPPGPVSRRPGVSLEVASLAKAEETGAATYRTRSATPFAVEISASSPAEATRTRLPEPTGTRLAEPTRNVTAAGAAATRPAPPGDAWPVRPTAPSAEPWRGSHAHTQTGEGRATGDAGPVPGARPAWSEPVMAVTSGTDMSGQGVPIPTTGSAGQAPAVSATVAAVPVQVAAALPRRAGQDTILRLEPEELGRVSLSLRGDERSMTLHIMAERSETLELLRRNIDDLARDLRDLGYDSLSFEFGQDGSDGAPGPSGGVSDEASQVDADRSSGREARDAPGAAPSPGNGHLDIRL